MYFILLAESGRWCSVHPSSESSSTIGRIVSQINFKTSVGWLGFSLWRESYHSIRGLPLLSLFTLNCAPYIPSFDNDEGPIVGEIELCSLNARIANSIVRSSVCRIPTCLINVVACCCVFLEGALIAFYGDFHSTKSPSPMGDPKAICTGEDGSGDDS